MEKNDNDDIAKVLDVLAYKLSKCTEEERNDIIEKLAKRWETQSGCPSDMTKYVAGRIIQDFEWIPRHFMAINIEKNIKKNSISDENKDMWK